MRLPCATIRPGICSTSGRPTTDCWSGHMRRTGKFCRRRGQALKPCTASSQSSRSEGDEYSEDDYINLGPQWQIPHPELGPLEQRVQTTFVEGLLKGDINLEDTEYWFTEPPGGWNQEEKIVKKAKIVPTTYAFADHPGVGRKPLSDFREGMEITGVVEAMYLYHGIRVDLGGEYDGLVPVETTEEAWRQICDDFKIDMEVKVRVHKVFNAPRCRFPIQLELVEPAHLVNKMLPPDLYAPAFDLRGISTVEDLAWATGMTVEEVTGGKDAELTILSNDMLQDMKAAVSSESVMEEWPEKLLRGAPPPPPPQFLPPNELDFLMASDDF